MVGDNIVMLKKKSDVFSMSEKDSVSVLVL